MPQLKEYIARPDNLTPPDTSRAAGEIAGGVYQGISSGLHSVGEALQRYGEMQETSKLHVGLTGLQTQAFAAWENLKTNGDITDPDTVQKFNDDYANNLQALTDNITSPAVRAHANELIAATAGDMARRTITDQALAARNQATETARTILNNLSDAAKVDPSAYEELRGQADFMAQASGLPVNEVPKYQIQIKREIAKATIDGLLDSGDLGRIQQARMDIEGGRFKDDLDATQQQAMLTKVRSAETQAREAETRQRELEKQQLKEHSDARMNEYIQGLDGPDLNYKDWATQVRRDPALTPEAKESLTRYGDWVVQEPIREANTAEAQRRAETRFDEQQARQNAAQHGEQFWQAWQAVTSGQIRDPQEITALAGPTGLKVPEVNLLLAQQKKWDASNKAADGYNALSANFYATNRDVRFERDDPDSMPKWINAFQAAKNEEEKERAAGKTPQEIFAPDGKVQKLLDQVYATPPAAPTPPPSQPLFNIHDLDRIARGNRGSQAGIAALKKAYAEGHITYRQMVSESEARGWTTPGAK